MTSIQSIGGKVRGKIQREEALAKYYADPNFCLCCSEAIRVSDNSTVAETRRKKFCNRSCAASYNNSETPKRIAATECIVQCLLCDDNLSLKKKISGGFYNRMYCNTCLSLQRISHLHGNLSEEDLFENQTKGSLYSRRKNWQSANSTLRNHSRKVYMASDVSKSCKVCGYSKHIEISHIKQVKDFPYDAKVLEINTINNLVALCPTHHWEFDNGLL